MEGYLHWKIIGPDINNPYAPKMPDRVLTELAHREDSLRRRLSIRCMCDGYEVMFIRNLGSPSVKTDHPCIGDLSIPQIFDYLEREGIEARVQQEVLRIQAELREELKRREQEDAEAPIVPIIKPKKKKGQAHPPKSNEGGYRIVRR